MGGKECIEERDLRWKSGVDAGESVKTKIECAARVKGAGTMHTENISELIRVQIDAVTPRDVQWERNALQTVVVGSEFLHKKAGYGRKELKPR